LTLVKICTYEMVFNSVTNSIHISILLKGFVTLSLSPQMNWRLIHNQEKGHLPPNTYSSNGIQIQNVLEKLLNNTIFSNGVPLWTMINRNNDL
jgi:hypothetical protein